MADTKVSALTAVSAVATTDEMPVNQGGVSKKMTVAQFIAFDNARTGVSNASVANQSPAAATDTYMTGSNCLIPATSGTGALKAGSMYRVKIGVSKTAAGTAAPVLTLRFGTAGSTADTALCAFTMLAQTAAIDTGLFEVFATFRTVGSGTTAVVQGLATLTHQLATTGLSTGGGAALVTSSGFNSTTASAQVGVSVNSGASAVWTVSMVQAELFNLA